VLFVVLVFGVLAFGAVEAWSELVLRCGAALLLALWATRHIVAGTFIQRWQPLYGPVLAFAMVVGVQLAFGLTAYGWATRQEALRYIAYAIFFIVASENLVDSGIAARFMTSVAWFGSVLALFALVQDFASNGKIYWLRKVHDSGFIFGPYVDHSHYAGLMLMLAPSALLLCTSPALRFEKRMLFGFGAVLMVGSIFLSGSRGGMVSLCAEMLVLAFLSRQRRKASLLPVAAVAAGVIALVFWAGVTPLLGRFAGKLDGGVTLWPVFKDCLRMFPKHPLFGFGFGTFTTVYPQFRSFYSAKFINQAHNDWVQVMVETGILGFACVVWYVVLLFRCAVPLIKKRGPSSFPVGAALIGCTGILIHSLMDFNLHIPANAAWFFVLGAIATAPSIRNAAGDAVHKTKFPSSR